MISELLYSIENKTTTKQQFKDGSRLSKRAHQFSENMDSLFVNKVAYKPEEMKKDQWGWDTVKEEENGIGWDGERQTGAPSNRILQAIQGF